MLDTQISCLRPLCVLLTPLLRRPLAMHAVIMSSLSALWRGTWGLVSVSAADMPECWQKTP